MAKHLQDIIELCKKKDSRGQKALFNYLGPTLLSVSRRYSPQGIDPKDNLQDAFIKIFNRISSYNSEKGNIESWAKKILINTSLDKLKKQRIPYFPEKDLMEIHTIDEMEQKANTDYLIQLIEKLPDGYKQIFNLYEIEGYNHQEIAGLIGISESTSRSQLNRCKQLLQKMISKSNQSLNNHLKAL